MSAGPRCRGQARSRAIAVGIVLALAVFANAHSLRAEETEQGPLRRAIDLLEAWDIDGAAVVLAEMQAQDPQAPETLWLRGRVLFEQGDYAGARAAFAAAKAKGVGMQVDEDLRLAENAGEEVHDAKVFESAHFILRAKAEKDHLLAPYALDALERAYAALTQDLGYRPSQKVRVEIYDSAEALARVSPLTLADIKNSGTIALCKYNRLMVTSPRALVRGYPWLDTVSHEFVHFLVTHKGRNKVPIWLQEGLAKFLETRWRGEPGKAIDPLQGELLVRAAKKKELIPFASMYPSIAKLPTQEAAALAFAEVEAAMRLLYQRGGQTALTELVAAMATGFSDERAVAQAYGKSFEQFDSDWRAEVAKAPPPSVESLAARRSGPRKLTFREDVKSKGEKAGAGAADDGPAPEPVDPAAKKSARLGELFFARGHWGAAANEYAKARAQLREEDPTLLRREGFSLLQLKRISEALPVLKLAVTIDREDSGAQVLYANALLFSGDAKGSLLPLQAAVEIDPFDPRVHKLWAEAAHQLHDLPVQQREEGALAVLYGRAPSGQSGALSPPPAEARTSEAKSGEAKAGAAESGSKISK